MPSLASRDAACSPQTPAPTTTVETASAGSGGAGLSAGAILTSWPLVSTEAVPEQPLPESLQRHIRRSYYSAVSWMDENVGRVLAALDASGKAEQTAVLLFADHVRTL